MTNAEYHKNWKKANPDKVKRYKYRLTPEQRAAKSAYQRKWRQDNPGKVKIQTRRRYENNPEKYRAVSAEYRKNNPEKSKASWVSWRRRNKDREKKRMAADPAFRLRRLSAHRIRQAIKSAANRMRKFFHKNSGTAKLLGCSFNELLVHIEKQFVPGMTREHLMRGEIHLDHIKPCAAFNLSDPEQQKQCFHYTNLQPLWAADNIRKGDKWQD